jgi:hypothetical protein
MTVHRDSFISPNLNYPLQRICARFARAGR